MREKREKRLRRGRKVRNESRQNAPREEQVDGRALKKRTRKCVNREISIIAYVFVILFAGLIAYLARFIAVDGQEVINSSYNKRQNMLEKSIQRGMILGSKGEILAKTEYDKNGEMTRVYPYDSLFAHTVGRYNKTKTGLENSMAFKLLTSSSNPIQKIFNDIKGKRSPGDNVVTTLDVNLQKVASEALGSKKGAVVVMEPSTGKILAMVSKPSYNPNTVDQNWEKLISSDNEDSALMNRATQGTYPPGSVYKIITAIGYMRQYPDSYRNFTYTCDGKYTIGDDVLKCAGGAKHGKVNMEEAFAKSCNGAFASMLANMDLSEFAKTNKDMLFNTSLDVDIPVRKPSYTLSNKDNDSLRARTAIGQGNTTTNPMHLAMVASAIANKGILMRPYIVDRIENAEGTIIDKTALKSYARLMSESEAATLTEYMEGVVTSGTAKALKTKEYTVAGKTGTAEIAGANPYSWFVGFASKNQADLVVSVCVENAGSSSSYAVPIAKKVFAAYYK